MMPFRPKSFSTKFGPPEPEGTRVILDTLKSKAIFSTRSGRNIIKPVTVFLDTGSEINLVTRDAAKGADGITTRISLELTSGSSVTSTEKIVAFKLMSEDGRYITDQFEATTLEKVSTSFKPIDVYPDNYEHLKNIPFTIEYPSQEMTVDILAGNEICAQILAGKLRRGKLREPQAKLTRLGWVLSGLY